MGARLHLTVLLRAFGSLACMLVFVLLAGLAIDFAAGPMAVLTVLGLALWTRWWARRRRNPRSVPEGIALEEPVRTARLVVRSAAPGDAAAVAATVDEVVVAAQGWTPAIGRSWFDATRWQASGQVPGFLVACDGETNQVLGVIAVSEVDRAAGSAHLGWWLGPAARGQGLGTEALAAGIGILHAQGIDRVLIGTREDNAPVQSSLAKVGARLAERKPYRLPDGTDAPSVWYVHERLPDERTP